jgi:hypothetical protein
MNTDLRHFIYWRICRCAREALWWLPCVMYVAQSASTAFCAPHSVALEVGPTEIRLAAGDQNWRFTKVSDRWALEQIEVRGKQVATVLSREDSSFLGGGEAQVFESLTNSAERKAIRFGVGTNAITYMVDSRDALPIVHVSILGPANPTCAFRTPGADAGEHGAWLTRGFVATDAGGREDFIDSSGPLVFGHSQVGGLDACYLFLPSVKDHVQRNGRTEQRSDTWFKSARVALGDERFSGYWHLRMGQAEPKEFAVLFDRDLGGRVSDVCEKYFARAVDTLVDLASVPRENFDPEKCLQVMPVRLAAPDSFIPGWGWMMDEFPKASYPFAHDSVWQTPALLAFEGLATGRDWEHNFARYFLDKTPLEGPDGKSYFVRRPGGLTRWGYFATYRDGFPHLDGGSWWQADILYRTALALNDNRLQQAALDLVLHDLNVKLDLEKMLYPPCWSAIKNRVGDDHRDDWFQTPGLAYCAYMAARVAYPETRDAKYLGMADRICEWFAGFIVPELKLNNLQGNNMHAVFSHYLTLAFLDKYERSHEKRFLDMARDMGWVHIMTTCITPAKDAGGHPLTGTTCVGVRGCVDYDCAPNLCQEKDLTFVHIAGPLLDHVTGPAYAKYLALHRLVLAKDSWKSAWAMELRDTNLRTMYDTYARGMANLVYALNRSSEPWVFAVDKLVSKSDTNVTHRRDLVVVNGTRQPRETRLETRFLRPGAYEVTVDGASFGRKTHEQLAEGFMVSVAGNSLRRVQVEPLHLDPEPPIAVASYDATSVFLSDLAPRAAQRGTGLPEPVFRKDLGFGGQPMSLGGKRFTKGLGCAANTVLLYELDRKFERFKAAVGVDDAVAGRTNPPPSVFFTVFVDGELRFESGPMFRDTPPRDVNVDVRRARTLLLRVSCNWDDNGNTRNDYGDWAEARMAGTSRP